MKALRGALRAAFRELPLRTRFGQGVIWNGASVMILGVAGLLISGLIARFYGAAVLGVFSQVLSIHFILGQLGAAGINFSVLRHASRYAEDPIVCSGLLGSALLLVAVISACVAGVAFVGRSVVGAVLRSPGVAAGLAVAAPGIACFSINKVLLSYINAQRWMRAHAVFQAGRYLLMLCFLLALTAAGAPGQYLPFLLSGSEVVLLIALLLFVGRQVVWAAVPRWRTWWRVHLSFGVSALPNGLLGEINTKVDVLMLGLFTGDAVVGIYSLAALVAEGMLQLPVVFRMNLNPLLTRLHAEGRQEDLRAAIRKVRNATYAVMGAACTVATVAFPLLLWILTQRNEFTASWAPFGVLMAGMAASSGYFPLRHLLIQTGFPGANTLFTVALVTTNLGLNAVLIPLLGLYGAAVATATSWLAGIVYLRALTHRLLGIRV